MRGIYLALLVSCAVWAALWLAWREILRASEF